MTGRGGCWQRQEKKNEDGDQEKKTEDEDQDEARSRRPITPSTRRQGRRDKTPAGASATANYTSQGKMGGLVQSSCCGGGGHAGRGGPSQGSQARTSAATLRWSEAQDKFKNTELEPRGGVRQPSLAFPSPAAPSYLGNWCVSRTLLQSRTLSTRGLAADSLLFIFDCCA